MSKSASKIACLGGLCFYLSLFALTVHAQNSAQEYQQSIDKINAEIKKLSQDLNTSKASKKNEQDKLFQVEKELKKVNSDIQAKQTQVKELGERLIDLEKTLEKQTSEVEEARLVLAEFIRKRYQNGQADYLKSLLSQENPYAVGRLENYHGYYRQALRDSYEEMTRKIQTTLELRAQVNDQREKRKSEEIALDALRLEQQEKVKAREQALRQIDKKIDQTKKSLVSRQERRTRLSMLLKQLKVQAQKLKQLEQKRAQEQQTAPPRPTVAGGFSKQKGRLNCPLASKPERSFGSRLPESGMRSEGLFYNTSGSKEVRSIFRGRVLFADFLKGYGLLIIVDHGDDHISLYGHNDRLLKEVGDTVEINEHIAHTGVTGGLKSHGLYFEIRQNTNPVDPNKWCR